MTARALATRRSLVVGTSFGIVSLYGLWAGLGLAPWPWEGGDGHGGEGGDERPTGAGHGGHGAAGAGPTPEEFRARTEAFVRRWREADGSVRPGPAGPAAASAGATHEGHGPPASQAHAMHGGATDPHAGHGAAPLPAPAAAMEPVEVYLMAFQWGFEPQTLRLGVGRPYRFRMMAVDVAHGAALQLGPASRVIRLRRGALVEQELTFTRPGSHLVYCTVFCGPGHELMAGRLLVG